MYHWTLLPCFLQPLLLQVLDDDLLEDGEVQQFLQAASTHELTEAQDATGDGSEPLQSGHGVQDVGQPGADVKEEPWDEQDWQNWDDWQHWDWQGWGDPTPWAWSVKREQDSNDYEEDSKSSSSKPDAYPPWAFKEKKTRDGLAGNLGRQDKLGGEYTLDGYTDPSGKSWQCLGFAIFVIAFLFLLFDACNLSTAVDI